MYGSRGHGTSLPDTAQTDTNIKKPNVFLSVLLCVFAFFFMLIFIILAVVRSLGVGHIIRNTDIVGILEEATVGEHTYYIVDQINGLPFNDVEVTLHDIEAFIQREAVTDELDVILDGYTTALILGNLDHHVTTEDIVNMARNLEQEFYELFDHRLTEDDYEHLAMTLDDIMDFSSLSIDGIMQDFDVDVTIPMILLSPVLIWSVAIVSIALLVLIFIQRRKNIADASLFTGIPIAFSGVVAFFAGLFLGARPEVLGDMAQRFARFIEDPVRLVTQYGFAFAAVGVTVIIVAFIFRSVAPRTDVV